MQSLAVLGARVPDAVGRGGQGAAPALQQDVVPAGDGVC